MKIYRIRTDTDHYRHFLPVDEVGFRAFADLDGSPRSDRWRPPQVRIAHPELRHGDFFSFGGGFLIANSRAAEALYTLFEMAGEMLALPYSDETYTVLNVTECINCLDHRLTTWTTGPSGKPQWIDRYVFSSYHLSESPIFKIPEEDRTAIFVTEGLMEPGEEFLEIVERERLEGLVLDEVWSSGEEEEGP